MNRQAQTAIRYHCRSPFELPATDRMTAERHLVTCTPWAEQAG